VRILRQGRRAPEKDRLRDRPLRDIFSQIFFVRGGTLKNRNATSVSKTLAILIPALLAPMRASAQSLSYKGCPDVTKADFRKVPLVTREAHEINEPIQMALAKDGRIFWVERPGLVRVWNPADKAATTLLDLDSRILTDLNGGLEEGLSGISLDPGFESNHWIYLYWAVKATTVFRLSRYTLTGNALVSEQAVIEIPFTNLKCCHTGGSMAFNHAGELFLAVGNTTDNGAGVGTKNLDSATNYVNEADPRGDDQRGSANTNSLLGKILRLKPKPIPDNAPVTVLGAGKTYDIPSGNLFPVGAYPADKTRPEIYTMGHRNPYTLSLDPYRNWLTWGDIGPDEFSGNDTVKTEEHNLVTKPGFMGWPYFVGKNQRYRLKKDPAKPTNLSKNNTGLVDLPPAQPAIHPYGHSASVTGPIYYYDGRLPSLTKLPPHFNKKWLYTDFDSGNLDVATVNEAGTAITDTSRMWKGFMSRPLDMEIGPDGNLYVLEYSGWFGPATDTRIARVEYLGKCLPTDLIPPATGLAERAGAGSASAGNAILAALGNTRVYLPAGKTGFALIDLRGRQVLERRGLSAPSGWVELPALARGGIYRVRYFP
jgi:cytochrome c